MLAILGPAKTIDISPHGVTNKITLPSFLSDSDLLVKHIRNFSLSELKAMLKVSDKLAILNFERYAAWKPEYNLYQGNHAIMAFSGEVFNGLQARSLAEDDLLFAQNNVRILSGLYGVLRPLDAILPYRLEMGAKLNNERGKNLYEFWQDIILIHNNPPKINGGFAGRDARPCVSTCNTAVHLYRLPSIDAASTTGTAFLNPCVAFVIDVSRT